MGQKKKTKSHRKQKLATPQKSNMEAEESKLARRKCSFARQSSRDEKTSAGDHLRIAPRYVPKFKAHA